MHICNLGYGIYYYDSQCLLYTGRGQLTLAEAFRIGAVSLTVDLQRGKKHKFILITVVTNFYFL